MRASVAVNCQSTCRWSSLVAACQAASSVLSRSRSSMPAEALPCQPGELDIRKACFADRGETEAQAVSDSQQHSLERPAQRIPLYVRVAHRIPPRSQRLARHSVWGVGQS